MDKISDEELKEHLAVYEQITASLIASGMPALEAASIMIVTALRIYKTVLSEEEFNEVVKHIGETKDRVGTYSTTQTSKHLH